MNPHHATGLFLYSLKTLKNQMLTSTLQIMWPEQYLDVLWKTVVEFLFVKVSGLVEKELCRKWFPEILVKCFEQLFWRAL